MVPQRISSGMWCICSSWGPLRGLELGWAVIKKCHVVDDHRGYIYNLYWDTIIGVMSWVKDGYSTYVGIITCYHTIQGVIVNISYIHI